MCPRCHFIEWNTFKINRRVGKTNLTMPVNKCKNKSCGFLWIEDKDLIDLSKQELEVLFILDLKRIGKSGGNL
jgi:hypothetical protein